MLLRTKSRGDHDLWTCSVAAVVGDWAEAGRPQGWMDPQSWDPWNWGSQGCYGHHHCCSSSSDTAAAVVVVVVVGGAVVGVVVDGVVVDGECVAAVAAAKNNTISDIFVCFHIKCQTLLKNKLAPVSQEDAYHYHALLNCLQKSMLTCHKWAASSDPLTSDLHHCVSLTSKPPMKESKHQFVLVAKPWMLISN